jgi:hypothetical protein
MQWNQFCRKEGDKSYLYTRWKHGKEWIMIFSWS